MPRDQVYHEFDHEGRHFKLVFDEDYQPDKCCGASKPGEHLGDEKGHYCAEDRPGGGGGGEDECEKFWQDEISKLESGEWVVLGCIVTTRCKGVTNRVRGKISHCSGCTGIGSEDSCWGIVVENDKDVAEITAREMF